MIPFNRAEISDREVDCVVAALRGGHLSGNGPQTKAAERLLDGIQGSGSARLTTSCTHALELSARLLDLSPGDEVIVPSFTFVSTASAFIWNGARPVFADVSMDTFTMDPHCAESLIGPRTQAISIVHYAGVGAKPDLFREIADRYDLILIEDNAHGLGGTWNDRPLGTFGQLATLSFHETKNVTCGEGGAIVVNEPDLLDRVDVLREKGTDRSRYLRGLVDKYTWVDVGSSWVLSEVLAALLVAQLERFADIQHRRHATWDFYSESLSDWANQTGVVLQTIPRAAGHTAHMFHLRLPDPESRHSFIAHLRDRGVSAATHYEPLHLSPIGSSLGGTAGQCPNTESVAATIVRLPLYASLTDAQRLQVVEAVAAWR